MDWPEKVLHNKQEAPQDALTLTALHEFNHISSRVTVDEQKLLILFTRYNLRPELETFKRPPPLCVFEAGDWLSSGKPEPLLLQVQKQEKKFNKEGKVFFSNSYGFLVSKMSCL